MPKIQLDMSEEQSDKLEHYKIAKKLRTKSEALLLLIDELRLDIKINEPLSPSAQFLNRC